MLSPLMAVAFVLGLFDTGSPIFLQTRVGRHQQPFTLIKFRTMKKDTASVGTHLASISSVTKLGGFLRKTKVDELPQLINVLFGQMSLVGPRPCLLNQEELVTEREQRSVYTVRPGITGLAQIHKVDMSRPKLLARYEGKMIKNMNLCLYFFIIIATILGKGAGDRI